jgi:hypothetical protein
MRVLIFSVAAALTVAGCSGSSPSDEAASREAPQEAYAVAAEDAMMTETASAAPPPVEPAPQIASAPMLAYDYSVGLEAPYRAVRPLLAAHEAACRDAGAALCQVLGSNVNAYGEDEVGANLSLRAEPRWLETFRGGLAGQAEQAGGRITQQGVTSEDLTRMILDTKARLDAQKTLRDRLRQILKERPGKLGELLETERELARVQGEIDSAESQLAVMRQRVAMSRLDISYMTKPNAVTGGTFEPVADAVTGFFSVVAHGLAAIILAIGFALPFVLVIAPIAWFILRRRAKARALRNTEQ